MDDVRIFDIDIFQDNRGYMAVPFDNTIREKTGFCIRQINQGFSHKACTMRGLHFQYAPYAQAKLVICLTGSIYNVAVDIRPDSPDFGSYKAHYLSAAEHRMVYIPKGFAHGYLTLEDNTLMQWYTDNDFSRSHAAAISFDDKEIGIEWPRDKSTFTISEKDINAMTLSALKEVYAGGQR